MRVFILMIVALVCVGGCRRESADERKIAPSAAAPVAAVEAAEAAEPVAVAPPEQAIRVDQDAESAAAFIKAAEHLVSQAKIAVGSLEFLPSASEFDAKCSAIQDLYAGLPEAPPGREDLAALKPQLRQRVVDLKLGSVWIGLVREARGLDEKTLTDTMAASEQYRREQVARLKDVSDALAKARGAVN